MPVFFYRLFAFVSWMIVVNYKKCYNDLFIKQLIKTMMGI